MVEAFRRTVDGTFNSLSIDTDTSTSDSVLLLANGAAGPVGAADFERALHAVCHSLTLQLAADGEGATKVVQVTVSSARDAGQAKRVAKAVVNSPLVKCAVHGADPNWGRVVMAIGKCSQDVDITPEAVRVSFAGFEVYPRRLDDRPWTSSPNLMRSDMVEIDIDARYGRGCGDRVGLRPVGGVRAHQRRLHRPEMAGVHPLEQLRYLARGWESGEEFPAQEAAAVLAELAADNPASLLQACRRLIEYFPSAGAAWWLSARALSAPEPVEGIWVAADELANDPTSRLVSESLPSGGAVAVPEPSSVVMAALRRRRDVQLQRRKLRCVPLRGRGPGGRAGRRARRAGQSASAVAAGARAGNDVWVVVERGASCRAPCGTSSSNEPCPSLAWRSSRQALSPG